MKALLVYLCLLFCSRAAYSAARDTIIVPVSVDKLHDPVVRKEVVGILTGKTDEYLYNYVTKCLEGGISYRYKKRSWMFHVLFNGSVHSVQGQDKFEADCLLNRSIIKRISFEHVKFMIKRDEHALSMINKELDAACEGHSVTFDTRSYISKDRYRNYLCLEIVSSGKKMTFVFVVNNTSFYGCVLHTAP